MAAAIFPFGKYKGQEVEHVKQRDPAYLQWLLQQPWFGEKFGPVYQVIVNNFAPPSEDTPAHNAMQVRFLDEKYRRAFCEVVGADSRTIGNATFEDVSDVRFGAGEQSGFAGELHHKYRLAIEIKPCMGDDYPAVLRQMKQQKPKQWSVDNPNCWFLLIGEFGSNTVTLDQVTQIFAADNIHVVLASEVRERLAQGGQC